MDNNFDISASNQMQDIAMLCTNDILELHVLPTEQCNFRCVYCYEDFEGGRMPPSIILGIKRLIQRRAPGLRLLNLAWFGGEPLTAIDVVEDICKFSTELSSEHDFIYRSSMTTNAWALTPTIMSRLLEVGVRDYQITLDGPQQVHDKVRRRADGAGTFQRVWSNLLAAKASSLNFNITIRLHIRPDTITAVTDWLPELQTSLICDPRFNVLVKPVEHLGGSKDSIIPIYRSDTSRHIATKSLYDRLVGKSAFRTDIFGRACYAGRPNAWVIRSNGDLARCTVALTDPANRVGTLLEDGTMIIDQEKLRPWFHGLVAMDDSVLGCPAKNLPRSI